MTESEHKELIKAAQNGDADAFEALINLYYAVMFKMAFKWCGRQDMAEDITQEACLKLARGIKSYSFKSKFTSWLYTLVLNTGRDFVKSDARHPESPDGLEKLPVKAKGEDAIYTRQVLAAIYELPLSEREAVLLVLNDGYTHAEAADILGTKEGTISWRISEAKKKLQSKFGEGAAYG
ncbi:MAG: RNA polymerase sigma factor [Alphaproteobacteria bacterium]